MENLPVANGYRLGLAMRKLLGVDRPRGRQRLVRQTWEAIVLRLFGFTNRGSIFFQSWCSFFRALLVLQFLLFQGRASTFVGAVREGASAR